ncbi:hypothetical protein [Belliella pelovolcani]|uniref:Uncharacterized protein n=1 Tax=Belliella pelovolcani TaxID=529505 RepID=A0A1N7PND0_9BACT|nr:hypothetical protein [Belliella pelovolcani]SIT12088.1 hypothetical protein SAMN05421761_11841 [Belliella pelovolcani]
MKTYALNLVRGGVFVLAAAFAFAFTQPKNGLMDEFGSEDGVTWYNVTNATPGIDYDCNEVQLPIYCLYDGPSTSANPIGDIEREFVLLNPELEPVDLD